MKAETFGFTKSGPINPIDNMFVTGITLKISKKITLFGGLQY